MPDVGSDVPATFGKYYLMEKLATGGMAEIYLAKLIGPNGFEKPLVIKQIHPNLSGQRQFVDLFVAEAKTLVTLAHGNIVPVYELGVVDDTYFIAMDYIDGPTLHRLTEVLMRRNTPMDPAIAAWIAARILDGLDYAHRKGNVIHRDLSPRNVMLSRDGEVKLVDFGIAVASGDAQLGAGSQAEPTGSFPYMSPEQVRREPLSPQSDLFSLGVLIWEMLVGRRLFARTTADATLQAVLEQPIPLPSHERPGIPQRLDEWVMRALQRGRLERWTSAADMLISINKYLYSLDYIPGPRDVAAMVASHCPPTTRRLSTDIEAMGRDGEARLDRSGPVTAIAESAPHTAVIPRHDPAPKGKHHRLQTFATHVALTDLLSTVPRKLVATPVAEPRRARGGRRSATGGSATTLATLGSPQRGTTDNDAIGDDPSKSLMTLATLGSPRRGGNPRRGTRDGSEARVVTNLRGTVLRRAGTHDDRGPQLAPVDDTAPAPTLLGRPPGTPLLIGGALIAIALLVTATYAFYQHRDDVLAGPSAMASGGPGALPTDRSHAQATAAVTVSADSHPVPRSNGSATRVFDPPAPPAKDDAEIGLRTPAPHASSARLGAQDASPPRDKPLPVHKERSAAQARSATLVVGANPWGDVFLDGIKLPRHAPADFSIPPGHHEVKVVFPAESPPLEKACAIDIAAGETKRCDADFTK